LESSLQGAWAVTISDAVLDTLKDHDIVMSHGDISPRNILVRGTKVVAILDWEMLGFYPENWDHASRASTSQLGRAAGLRIRSRRGFYGLITPN